MLRRLGQTSEPQSHYTTPDDPFDELAKGLASGTFSRGKALRMVSAVLVGGALASIPGAAWAKKKPGKPKKKCQDFEDCLPGQDCISGECRCGEFTTLCGGVCCETEFCCGGEKKGVCCGNPNTSCVDGECVCNPGLATCNGGCCNEGDVCVPLQGGGVGCCDPGDLCEGNCCPHFFEAHACCSGVCCAEAENCVNGECGCGTGPSCPAGTECVPGTGTCCPTDQWCPTDFSTTNAICCPEGTSCIGNCFSSTQECFTECCPVERICGDGLSVKCCAEGTLCQQETETCV
jgi:hypothetical protein